MADASFIPSTESIESSRLFKALHALNALRASNDVAPLENYRDLYTWSVEAPEEFWRWALHSLELSYEGQEDPVIDVSATTLGARFFPNLKLNFTDNLLKHGAADQTAIIALSEARGLTTRTYKELSDEVDALAYYLHAIGIQPGDRVAGLTSNSPEAVVSLLACAAIGAVFTSASPEFGMDALEARFGQVEPRVIIACNGYAHGGKTYDSRIKVNNLLKVIPSIEHIILYEESPELDLELYVEIPAVTFDAATSCAPDATFEKPSFDFNHPLYILYSSGTTGKPKCLVHGTGGTLLQHAKEHRWHGDLRQHDKLFYIATCGWMTWNWLISGLQAGAAVCLYDGAPRPKVLWDFVNDQGITHFGASPGFFSNSIKRETIPDSPGSLRTLYSTGAPLHAELASKLQEQLPNVRVQSVCGGTDIVSCFLTGNPLEPIHPGQIQGAGLGMAVVAPPGEPEHGFALRCKTPFPSMPISLWNDASDELYRATYFPDGDDIWHQGDWCIGHSHENQSMGITVVGRIDGTLNPRGIRFGASDIYAVLSDIEALEDTLAIAKRSSDGEAFVLAVQRASGLTESDEAVIDTIQQAITDKLSPRHKPTHIIFIDEFPRTLSGKKVETLIGNAVNGTGDIDTSSLDKPDIFQTIVEAIQSL